MSPGAPYPVPTTDSAEDDPLVGQPRVLLFMQPGRDRELLADTLGQRYDIETTTDVESFETAFDCCVFDTHEFNRVAGTVQSRRDTSKAVFLPFVLLVGGDADEASASKAWEYVDDVIELPVEKAALLARIGNLVERRRTAARLAKREAELAETIEDLTLKERAMDAAPVGISIADTGEEDNPMIYVNDQFKEITGYTENVLGEDCRFLQGEETDPETRATIRAAIDAGDPVSVDILNYRKNGQKFWDDPIGFLGYVIGFTAFGWYLETVADDPRDPQALVGGAVLGAFVQAVFEGAAYLIFEPAATPVDASVSVLGNTVTHGLLLGAIPLVLLLPAFRARVEPFIE